MLALLLFAGMPGISAMLPDIQEMPFSFNIRQKENCEICYGSDCLHIGEDRCEYYRRTDRILWDDPQNSQAEDTEVRGRIDGYLMEYVHQDTWTKTDCIPLVSQYTNCNRENVCTGCQTCSCDGLGRWNCTMVERCEIAPGFDFDHTMLAVVTNKLKNYKLLKGSRRKRSVIYEGGTENDQMNYEDIMKLLYGMQNFEHNHIRNSTEKIVSPNNVGKTAYKIDTNIRNTEYLRFEELLKNIDNYKSNNFNLDSVTYAKNRNLWDKSNGVYLNSTNTENNRDQINKNDIFLIKSAEMPSYNYLNKFGETKNLKKREILLKHKDSQNNDSSMLFNKSSTKNNELSKNVLYPLFDFINEKQKELEQLMIIKDKLVLYFKSFTRINISNNARADKNLNSHLYFYELEMPAESNEDNKISKQNILDKNFKKLKRDLLEVIRDIANIGRLSNFSAMPHDLEDLIQSIKYYGNKENQSNKRLELELPIAVHSRRRFDIDLNPKQSQHITILYDIFETLSKDLPASKALNMVSKGGKPILKRIIKQLIIDKRSSAVVNNQYKLDNVLSSIGNEWDKIIAHVLKSSLSDQLYSIKLLLLEVSADISKIKHALELVLVPVNRRLIKNEVTEKIISKLGYDLKQVSRLIKQTIQLQVLNKHLNKNKSAKLIINSNRSLTPSRSKNRTGLPFLQTIKRLLKNSKQDIRDMFQKKLPKSDIIKHIAKKKFDEMTKKQLSEYEEIMQRWQNNLNVRHKRSPGEIQNFFNRLKNIIPGYLRGKVKPSHKKNANNRTSRVSKKKSHRGNKTNKRIKVTSSAPRKYVNHSNAISNNVLKNKKKPDVPAAS